MENYRHELSIYHEAVPGAYFRANVWAWRPVVNLIHDMGLLSEEDIEGLCYNSGHVLDSSTCLTLAKGLGDWLEQNKKELFKQSPHINEKEFNELLILGIDGRIINEEKYKSIKREHRTKCEYCMGTGFRPPPEGPLGSAAVSIDIPNAYFSAEYGEDKDWLAFWKYQREMDEISLQDLRDKFKGTEDIMDCTPCNACHATGLKENMDYWYAISIDHFKEFIVFLEQCGGCEIY